MWRYMLAPLMANYASGLGLTLQDEPHKLPTNWQSWGKRKLKNPFYQDEEEKARAYEKPRTKLAKRRHRADAPIWKNTNMSYGFLKRPFKRYRRYRRRSRYRPYRRFYRRRYRR